MSWAEAGDPAAAYATALLGRHGVELPVADAASPRSLAADWAESGAMALTRDPTGPPQLVTGAPATTIRGALLALSTLARAAGLDADALPDSRVLGERAALLDRPPRSTTAVSISGGSRLFDAQDGRVAITLSRLDDFDLIPALVERDDVEGDPTVQISDWARRRSAAEIVERAALIGLAVGAVDPTLPDAEPQRPTTPRPIASVDKPLLVVDLSALWAGPLCAHLLGRLGARVLAVESTRRPDPTPIVAPAFNHLLRGDAERVGIDFGTVDGIASLSELMAQADVVIEASRPRALQQLGIDAAAVVAQAKRCSWVSITAYGRAHNRIGYGDDVAAAAGLLGTDGGFAGDAIADPLTGAHAAVAALATVVTGQSAVLDVAMHDIARAARTPTLMAAVIERNGEWFVDDGAELVAVRPPTARVMS